MFVVSGKGGDEVLVLVLLGQDEDRERDEGR
jgi:hypothetical protein